VGVGRILIRIEHLYFIAALKKDPAIASILAGAAYFGRCGTFDVQLHVAELLLRGQIPCAGDDLHIPVLKLPETAPWSPLREILAVEQHDCIRWCAAGLRR